MSDTIRYAAGYRVFKDDGDKKYPNKGDIELICIECTQRFYMPESECDETYGITCPDCQQYDTVIKTGCIFNPEW